MSQGESEEDCGRRDCQSFRWRVVVVPVRSTNSQFNVSSHKNMCSGPSRKGTSGRVRANHWQLSVLRLLACMTNSPPLVWVKLWHDRLIRRCGHCCYVVVVAGALACGAHEKRENKSASRSSRSIANGGSEIGSACSRCHPSCCVTM